jgi:hypothetical protein
VSSQRHKQCGLPSFIPIICIMLWWLHCICFSRHGLFWSQSESSYCSLGNSPWTCKLKWKRWVLLWYTCSSLIYMSHTCTHRKLRGRCILFWIGIKLKFRHTLLEEVTLSKAGWGICLSLISTWRIWLFNNRTALANPRSDICACAAIIVSPALSWGKKSYILLVARGCFVVKSSVCCL